MMMMLAVLMGCNSTCQQTCRQLVECEGIEHSSTTQNDCEFQCEQQEYLYESWEDQDLQDRHADYRNCVVDSSCVQIEDGACYDEELFAY